MRKLFFILCILCTTLVFAQSTKNKQRFSYEVCKVKGDLNGDNIADIAIVTQDTIDHRRPYRLQIFFADPNQKLKLILSTTTAIEAQLPDGGDGNGTGHEFVDITIKKGVLSINNGLIRGHFEHKFRFQKGAFELISYSHISSSGDCTWGSTDFNLITGNRVEKVGRCDTNYPDSTIQKKVIIRPLPKLQDFKPYTNLLYY